MRRIQVGIAFIQTNILYDMVGGKMCVAVSAFLYFSLGLTKKIPLASVSQLTGCVVLSGTDENFGVTA